MAPGWARPATTARPSGPILATSKLGIATLGRRAVCGAGAATGAAGAGAGAGDAVAAGLAGLAESDLLALLDLPRHGHGCGNNDRAGCHQPKNCA